MSIIQVIAQRGAGFIHPVVPFGVSATSQIFTLGERIWPEGFPDSEKVNLFFAVAFHKGSRESLTPVRKASTFDYQTVLAWDIDGVPQDQVFDYAAAISEVLQVPLPSLTLVASGNGMHAYVHLKTPIRDVKYFKDNKPHYNEICRKIKWEFDKRGLKLTDSQGNPGKVDPVVFEPARVLRLPGTINRKPGQPDKKCELKQYSDVQLDMDLKVLSGLGDIEKENILPHEVRRNYPNPDLAEMVKECRFIQELLTNPKSVHEPDVFDLNSLLASVSPGAKVLHDGVEKTAKEIAYSVHQNASASRSLERQTFQEKWEQGGKYGSRKCETINQRWGKCNTCPHYAKIQTPLALKSKEHIGSEATGFWVLNSKGQHSHPHYEDLAKVFSKEIPYVTTKDERVMAWDETYYRPLEDGKLKSWIEYRVSPSEPLRKNHRSEFLEKIKVRGFMSSKDETYLFEESITGKLNCKNGVLDIRTGELIPHDPKIGFQNQLPYDYVPNESSEFFIDWLGTITQDRVELMESLLDLMGYILWPSYDDHLFAFFVGEGKNGKSTLIRVMAAMVGQENYSSVNVTQLCSNRFAPAALEGKLVNLSEESSGVELDYEQMNVIKNLSAGGEMHIERKGEDGYSFNNKAKLIFSANKPPRFLEKGEALRRRLLTIPFDHIIEVIDDSVGDRLVREVPQIMSMIVSRIQANIAKNEGKYVVNRGGSYASAAQRTMLTEGSTVVEWSKECIESKAELSLDTFVTSAETYAHYRVWCEESGYKNPVNKIVFGKTMKEFVVSKACREDDCIRRIGNKPTRGYPRTKFKEGVENVG